MKAIRKMSLVETVAADLAERIKAGELGPSFPGVRLLARTLNVSVPTVCRALHWLEGEGLLESAGDRRRWRVKSAVKPPKKRAAVVAAPKVRAGSSNNAAGRLLFLTARPLGVEKHSGVEVFAELLDHLTVKGWEVMYRVEKFSSAKSPRRSWDELVRMTEPDAIVVLLGTSVLAEWAKRTGIRTLFFGGDVGESGVPILSLKVQTMLRQALEHLFSTGHRSVLFPLCERTPVFVKRCRDLAAETAAAWGLEEKTVVLPETAYARPEVLVNLLRRHCRKQVPDAVVFLDWREFMAASCFFNEMGIVIPRDLSVIILSQNANMDWFLPNITHFQHPVRSMAKIIAKWVA
jgi:DNA-binding LacI/PurR family transcriptional regulator